MGTGRVRDAGVVLAEYTAESVYGLSHPAWHRSGASGQEQRRRLPGDNLVAAPTWTATRAETIAADPEQVWPWIVQLGYGRGGYYGDFPWWRDPAGHTGRRASADVVLPAFQHVQVGDVLLDGPGCSRTVGAWTVRLVEPPHALVLSSSRTLLAGREVSHLGRTPRAYFDCSWAFVLEPSSQDSTRLLVRTRVRTHPAWLVHAATVLRTGDTVMQRAMLAGIKRRAEHAGDSASDPGPSHPAAALSPRPPRGGGDPPW